jgi:cell division protein ZapA
MSTQVEIFGAQYTFQGQDPDHVRRLADHVNRTMAETAKSIRNVTTTKVAVLAAMNIADDLLTLRDSTERSDNSTSQRLDNLLALSKSLASLPTDETND